MCNDQLFILVSASYLRELIIILVSVDTSV